MNTKIDTIIISGMAAMLLQAAKIREESYDKKKAAEVLESDPHTMIDFNTFYNKSLRQAVEEACDAERSFVRPIELLLYSSWNDSLAWAESVVKEL